METGTLEIIISAICLLSSFLFSAAETALTAVSRARIYTMMQDGVKGAALVNQIRQNKDAMISTILMGNTLANMAAASVITIICIEAFGAHYGPLYATLILTAGVLLFCEVLPKTIAIHNTERAALMLAPFVHVVMKVLWPFTRMVQFLVRGMLRMAGVDYRNQPLMSSNELIRGAIEMHHSEGAMIKEDRDMLGSILDLNNREVSEVMLHRKQVMAIDMALDPDTIISQAIASGHSRIPLYRDEAENILGVLHVKDLLKLVRQQKIGITREMIRQLAHKAWFVPETTNLADQLAAFRGKRMHFAFVVDEYGAWLGIVTLEDILEEIVGKIDDEHDARGIDEIISCGTNKYRVAGTVTIRDMNRALDWDLPDSDATTIAGLVMHEARVIPEKGAVLEFYGYRFVVEERKNNQILQVMVEALDMPDEYSDAQE